MFRAWIAAMRRWRFWLWRLSSANCVNGADGRSTGRHSRFVPANNVVTFSRRQPYTCENINDDLALLREYAATDSEAAFATLATRHVSLVYSVALRQVRDPPSGRGNHPGGLHHSGKEG
jgi:hypothetical protein